MKTPTPEIIVLWHSLGELIDTPCRYYGVSREQLFSPERTANVVHARDSIALLLHDAGWSYPKIGRLLGRHHTSVHRAAHRARVRRGADSDFARMLLLAEIAQFGYIPRSVMH